MATQLMESEVKPLSEYRDLSESVLTLASANLRYHLAGEDHYFPIQRLSMCSIGRSSTNNITFDDRLLSREHAMIRCTASGICKIEDIGSSNGTRVNGVLVLEPVTLRDGDVIQVGQHAMTFIQSLHSAAHIIDAEGDSSISSYPQNSLITALSLNIRGYANLGQILGAEQLGHLMEEVAAIAGNVFTRRQRWQHKHEGSAVHAVWAHQDDRMSARDLLNIFDAVAEIQLDVRPLQKSYHLLRPIAFGCGIATGHAMLENLGEAVETDMTSLCDIVLQAYQLEVATHALGCDMLIGETGLNLLSPRLDQAYLPTLCSVSAKATPKMMRAYTLRFDELGALSAAIADATARGQ
jgi:adenylate cyclase